MTRLKPSGFVKLDKSIKVKIYGRMHDKSQPINYGWLNSLCWEEITRYLEPSSDLDQCLFEPDRYDSKLVPQHVITLTSKNATIRYSFAEDWVQAPN